MKPVQLRTRFGKVIRRRRLIAQIGQEALADLAKIHRTHLSLIERGERMPTLFVVHQLATALGTTMVELMEDVESDEEPEEPPPAAEGATAKGRQGEETGLVTSAEEGRITSIVCPDAASGSPKWGEWPQQYQGRKAPQS